MKFIRPLKSNKNDKLMLLYILYIDKKKCDV